MGMCEAVFPTFIGKWLITPEDVNEVSSYVFDVERTLNRLVKVDQISEQKGSFCPTLSCANVCQSCYVPPLHRERSSFP